MLKLLDYDKLNPVGSVIGKPRKLAWPVNAYRVTLPKVSGTDDGLNAFERVILKLLDAVGVMDADELAAETRIPLDLVKGILLRLQDKALIDGHNAIIKQGHDEGVNEGDNAPVFVTALLFRELATGKILPFLHWLDDTNPLRQKEGEESYCWTIRWDDTHKRKTPTQRDVINALRAMKKRVAAFGMEDKMPAVQQITITAEPELYHLDCPIAIQKSDSEFRIADPFGTGFSLILEKAFEQLLERDDNLAGWLLAWKQLLSTPRTEKQYARPKEPFETDANWQRYPRLIASLRLASNAEFRSFAKIHASIEWALFYACCVRPFKEVIVKLKFTEQSQHPALLAQAAQIIGLEPPPQGFRPIQEGKLREFEDGGAYLGTVIAMSMLQAQGDASHPLRRIASARPDLINRLLEINAKRNEKSHGKGAADSPQRELSDDPFMREVIHTLLPDIVFAKTPDATPNLDARADALLDARSSIQSEFGFKQFNRLGADLQDRLIHAERFWLGYKDGDDALGFVVDVYAATQAQFHQTLASQLPPDSKDDELVTVARNKAQGSGMGDLPDALHTVKPSMIRQALQGKGPTLGACALAFLLVSDEETLGAVAASQPSFVSDVANLITRRGHGNEPRHLIKAEIAKLRKAALSTIKTLIEQ